MSTAVMALGVGLAIWMVLLNSWAISLRHLQRDINEINEAIAALDQKESTFDLEEKIRQELDRFLATCNRTQLQFAEPEPTRPGVTPRPPASADVESKILHLESLKALQNW